MKAVLITLFFLLSLSLQASSRQDLPSSSLVARGKRFMDKKEHLDSAVYCLNTVVRRYYEHPDDKRQRNVAVEAMRYLGKLYVSNYKDYGKAYQYISLGIQIAEEDQLVEHLPYLYINMANLWNTNDLDLSKGHEKVVDYLRRAFQVSLNSHNHRALLMAASDMAISQLQARDFDKELALLHRMKQRNEIKVPEFDLHFILGCQELALKRYASAEQHLGLAAAAAMQTKTEGERDLLLAAMFQSKARKAMGDLKGARALLYEYLDYAQKLGDSDLTMSIYLNLALNYDQAGMDDSASSYEYKCLVEREKLRQQNLPDLSEIISINQIESLTTDMRQLSIRYQQRQRQMAWLGASALVLLILALAGFWVVRTQRRAARVLYAQNQALLARCEELKAGRVLQASDDKGAKYKRSALDTTMSTDLYQRLLLLMDTREEIYSTGFKLENLAEMTGVSARYVSQAINENAAMNFNQLLGEYRIREACRRLDNHLDYGRYTIEAIAESVGIASRTTFSLMFKKYTGMSPAQYRKQAMSSVAKPA